MKLVIVESPKKARDITGFFGKNDGWEIRASFGHVRDLPLDDMGIDFEKNFAPKYVVAGDDRKKKNTRELAELVKKADVVFLATDPDREGEAISWHLMKVLKVPKDKLRRTTWTEVGKDAVLRALDNPRDIDLDLVMAQQARRVMDRLVGYSLSPFLGTVLPQYRGKGSLSAGRVQSAVMKVIVDREREILAFVPEEYWAIAADLGKQDGGGSFRARLSFLRRDGELEKVALPDAAAAESARAALDAGTYHVSSVTTKPGQRKAPAPFSAGSLTSEASRKLGFKSKYTMELAQALFEGFSIDGEQHGLITYHRTDSVNLSDDAVAAVRSYIAANHGEEFLPAEPNVFKTKVKNAQEAHEAIRPKDMAYTPERVADKLTKDQLSLYELIWKRTLACQMKPAEVDRTEVLVDNGDYVLKATGSTITFRGFLEVYEESVDEDKKGEDDGSLIPPLVEGEALDQLELLCEKKATTPPSRFTEPQLNEMAQAKGIFRPSTFPGILELIEKRDYVEVKGKRYYPTEKGMLVISALETSFPDVIDIGFTARSLEDFDAVAAGERVWHEVIAEFYGPFEATLKQRRQEYLAAQADPDNPPCPECGGPTRKLYRKDAKGRRTEEFFFSCVRYPDCRGSLNADGTTGFPEREEEVHETETCPKCGGRLFKREGKSKATGKPYLFWGCEHHKDAGCDYTLFPEREEVAYEGRVCPECGGRLLKREGTSKSGKKYLFYGCENHKDEGIRCGYTFDPKGATGIACPKCGKGELVERTAKSSGKKFWVCDRGREKCDGVSWDDPRTKAAEPQPEAEAPAADTGDEGEDREF